MNRDISHTGHQNYFTIVLQNNNGQNLEYEIYFEMQRDKTDKRLHLIVTSAFPRDPARIALRPKRNKVKFATILFNVQHNKPFRVQK
jgi:hypothetical protein